MYCRNCGKLINRCDMICAECLVPIGAGEQYCQACGSTVDSARPSCEKCGARLAESLRRTGQTGAKSKHVAAFLAFTLGVFGAHNFYLGFKKWGIAQLVISCTVFLSFISFLWGIIDGCFILCDRRKEDALGYALRK